MPKKSHSFISVLRTNRLTIYLIFIVASGLYLRSFNLNWDDNYYFHPDERAIVMFTTPLRLPISFSEFFSVESPMNPKFFAYGNFPLYLLAAAGFVFSFFDPVFSQYGGIHIVGRAISVLFDTGSIIIVYLLGLTLFNRKVGVFASLLYAFSVFPIQLSHFYAVDTLLNFFMLSFLLFLILFVKKQKTKLAILGGVLLGLSLATKISALFLMIPLFMSFIIVLAKHPTKKVFSRTLLHYILITIVAAFIFFVTQPYALINFDEFIKQTSLQSRMGSDPFVFPYTLQYVGKIPYLYELKNIFLFGMGPVIATICFAGILFAGYKLLKDFKKQIIPLLILSYGLFYFLVFGKFAVGWMRYMLPVYPILSLFGGYLLFETTQKLNKITKDKTVNKLLLLLFLLVVSIYPFSFLSIYTKPNTRIQATEWMEKNIPPGSTIAVEHWDDALPVGGGGRYIQLSLPLYDPDTPQKWEQINQLLSQTEYLIIASNRLYTPLQKLTNCDRLPQHRCYPITAQYYKDLFSGKRGFRKVAEFAEYPTIPFLNLKINDQGADESFTVYDHPKIMIFKKE